MDGSVVAWGEPNNGGDCSAVQDPLIHVRQVQATYGAFAAILADGSVVAWGNPRSGGDCSAVQDELQHLQVSSMMFPKASEEALPVAKHLP